MTMAIITILGRLGRDPETRHTAQGKAVVSFSLAVDDGFGENKHTTWFRCQAWEKTGEGIAKHFAKGDPILVVGNPISREWTDNSGQKHAVLEINVQRWSFAGAKRDTASAASSSYSASNDEDVPF